ncbi:c-type cytochrome [Nitrosomonas sp.]|uniref:c-type cytochrome n=1 Tax=Nitrosomonas sp. TaxID=42353 RepID=UPI001E1427B3|nr:cytochrome c [Nitrosomonas sp.]MBX3615548.1 c-type cytochrome [Nitrosomonas sp.]
MRNSLLSGVTAALLMGCGDTAPPVSFPWKQLSDSNTAQVERNFDPAQIQRGESVYNANCIGCHGPNGAATPEWRKPGPDGKYPPPPLDSSAHAWHHSTDVLKKTILKGTPPEIGSMPAWEGKLTEQQVDDVIVWIKSLWSDEIYDLWYKNFEGK